MSDIPPPPAGPGANESGGGPGSKSHNPLEQLVSLLALVDPVEIASRAVDTTRRTTESMILILENLASTVDNLNRTTTRVNSLLDEIEEPLRRLMPQMGAAMGAMATLGEAASQLAEVGRRLSPLAAIAENAGGLLNFLPGRGTQPPPASTPDAPS